MPPPSSSKKRWRPPTPFLLLYVLAQIRTGSAQYVHPRTGLYDGVARYPPGVKRGDVSDLDVVVFEWLLFVWRGGGCGACKQMGHLGDGRLFDRWLVVGKIDGTK